MSYGRLALAAAVATLADGIYGFVVYGNIISGEFARYPAIYRSTETQTAYLPVMFLGLFFAMLVATYLYAKGYEGGSGVQEGMRFGVLIGLLTVGYVAGVNYAIMNIGMRMAAAYALAGLVEWVVVGMVMGFIYHPVAKVRAGAAGV